MGGCADGGAVKLDTLERFDDPLLEGAPPPATVAFGALTRDPLARGNVLSGRARATAGVAARAAPAREAEAAAIAAVPNWLPEALQQQMREEQRLQVLR